MYLFILLQMQHKIWKMPVFRVWLAFGVISVFTDIEETIYSINGISSYFTEINQRQVCVNRNVPGSPVDTGQRYARYKCCLCCSLAAQT